MGEAVDNVILEFPILYEGWECDYTAWVIERADGSRYLKMTNHGFDCVGDVSLLDKKLAEYRDWETDRKSTRLNSSHSAKSRMPSSA